MGPVPSMPSGAPARTPGLRRRVRGGGGGAGAAVGPTSRVLTSSGSREPRSAGLTSNAQRCPSDPSLSAPGSRRGYVCVFGTAVRWRTGCRSRSVKSARPASHAVLGGGRSETVQSVRLRGCFCGTPATPPPGHGGGPLGARRFDPGDDAPGEASARHVDGGLILHCDGLHSRFLQLMQRRGDVSKKG